MTRRREAQCTRGHLFDEKNTHMYRDKRGVLRRVCRACAKIRNGFRERLYGLSQEDYDELLAGQHGVCAICGGDSGSRALAVDHDHASGAIRGLLCSVCNTGLGGLRDDPALLRRAISYLEAHARGAGVVALEQPVLTAADREHLAITFDFLMDGYTGDLERLAAGRSFSETLMSAHLPDTHAARYDARFAASFLVGVARVWERLRAGVAFPAACVAEEIALHAVLRTALDTAAETAGASAERLEAFMHGTLPDLDFLLLFDTDAHLTREQAQAVGATHLWFEDWFRPFDESSPQERVLLN